MEFFSAIVEMKSQCSSISAAKERRRLNSERQHSCVSCYSDELRKRALKKSEAVKMSVCLLFK